MKRSPLYDSSVVGLELTFWKTTRHRRNWRGHDCDSLPTGRRYLESGKVQKVPRHGRTRREGKGEGRVTENEEGEGGRQRFGMRTEMGGGRLIRRGRSGKTDG